MARAAGNNPGYTFVLRNDNTGRYIHDVQIVLPSSTTIIKRTLAAPQLVPWAYRTTRDNIAGLVNYLVNVMNVSADDVVDCLSDADWLEEYLKENGLRPDDVRDERADEGTREHETLERLASLDHDDSMSLAARLVDSTNPREVAISSWWLAVEPHVVAAERVLPCPQHGFCGTADLVWYDGMVKVVTDLKTRRAGLFDYTSDQYQVDSYRTAYNLLHPDAPAERGSVLLAFDDGTYDEAEVILPPGSFLELKAVDDKIQYARMLDKDFGR